MSRICEVWSRCPAPMLTSSRATRDGRPDRLRGEVSEKARDDHPSEADERRPADAPSYIHLRHRGGPRLDGSHGARRRGPGGRERSSARGLVDHDRDQHAGRTTRPGRVPPRRHRHLREPRRDRARLLEPQRREQRGPHARVPADRSRGGPRRHRHGAREHRGVRGRRHVRWAPTRSSSRPDPARRRARSAPASRSATRIAVEPMGEPVAPFPEASPAPGASPMAPETSPDVALPRVEASPMVEGSPVPAASPGA